MKERAEYEAERKAQTDMNRQQAIRMKAEGKKQKEIATALNVSVDTVKSYFRKKVY